jgi:hypothetical protein
VCRPRLMGFHGIPLVRLLVESAGHKPGRTLDVNQLLQR